MARGRIGVLEPGRGAAFRSSESRVSGRSVKERLPDSSLVRVGYSTLHHTDSPVSGTDIRFIEGFVIE